MTEAEDTEGTTNDDEMVPHNFPFDPSSAASVFFSKNQEGIVNLLHTIEAFQIWSSVVAWRKQKISNMLDKNGLLFVSKWLFVGFSRDEIYMVVIEVSRDELMKNRSRIDLRSATRQYKLELEKVRPNFQRELELHKKAYLLGDEGLINNDSHGSAVQDAAAELDGLATMSKDMEIITRNRISLHGIRDCLHGSLSETVCMQQPPGFQDSQHPDHVCLLQRSLYGLKQAPRAWFQRFAAYAARVGFIHSRCDTSLFIYRRGSDTAYLLLYVDDIILTASSTAFLQSIIATLHAEFSMTDLGPLNYFLGISVTRNTSGMFLSQQKYASELLERAGMLTCNPCRTPVDTDSKLSADGDPVSDPTLYRSLAGALQYLTFTRPDISYAVQQVCLYMHDPREPHFSALKRILRYIRGTMPYGLQLFSSTTSSLVAYSDADWAGCPTTRRSTSGYCVFLGNNLLSWSSKRQVTLSRSSAEAEYRGVANAVAETCWLRNLLRELHTPLSTATLVYCDNVSAVYLSSNPVQHQRTKHIEIDIHFVRDLVAAGHIRVLHVPSRYQYADIFTKGLPTVLFDEFRSSLSVRSSPAQTAGGC
ncbi:ribonuclease H-like domain-containing protein [Tanacetum coccineum]